VQKQVQRISPLYTEWTIKNTGEVISNYLKQIFP
jgi:hypothetical protein